MPSGKNNETDDQSYLTQEIEVDAIAYAHLLIKRELDIITVIPDVIKENVLNRVNELMLRIGDSYLHRIAYSYLIIYSNQRLYWRNLSETTL